MMTDKLEGIKALETIQTLFKESYASNRKHKHSLTISDLSIFIVERYHFNEGHAGYSETLGVFDGAGDLVNHLQARIADQQETKEQTV